jgi:DNA replication protein DnaC
MCTFKNFDVNTPDVAAREQLLQAKSISQRYVDDFLREEGGFCESGLLFIGPSGVGKTHLAAAVLRALIERFKVQGLFVDFTSLIHQIQSTFDPSSAESKHDVLDPVIEVEILVLDELGAQKPSAWVNEILYLIMNSRYTRRLPTLFTTNYRLESGVRHSRQNLDRSPAAEEFKLLSSRISASLLSRLYEMARPVEIHAEDFRREVRMQKHRV